jgi:hypothetical protein
MTAPIGERAPASFGAAPSTTTQTLAPAPAPRPTEAGPHPFARILHGLGKEADRGEALVQGVLHGGGSHDAMDLLRLQAGVYRYTEAIDLATKLVDRATSGVKTVIQGQ